MRLKGRDVRVDGEPGALLVAASPHMTRLPRLLLPVTACLAVAVPAESAMAAKAGKPSYPSITEVAPMELGVGDTLTLRGKGFRAGKGRNTVVFQRTGGRAIFVKAGKATKTAISVTIPPKMLSALGQKSGKPVATRFRIRVLAGRLGRRFTTEKNSPVIGPRATTPESTANDCDRDLVPNTKDADDDNDLLSDTLEATLKTDPCNRDSDGDGMTDGWEHESALDYNGRAKPAPLRRPYPNALDAKDGKIDSDGDGLTNALEYAAWATYGQNKLPLSYSGGNPASDGRNKPAAGREWNNRDANDFLSDNERDADGDGIPNQDEGGVSPLPVITNVAGFFSDEYIALDEVRGIVDVVPLYGPLDYVHKVLGTDWLDADSDGDTVRDDADDQDGDGLSNVAELLTELSAGPKDKLQRPLNPCEPNLDSRLCIVGDDDIDNDGLPNRGDDDDDGDGLTDTSERQYGLNPYKTDTDRDGISDGYEYQSAIDLNSAAVPYPGKRPYPNPLDGQDASQDFDGDGLTLTDEYRAWRYSGSPTPLSYSDGSQHTAGGGLSDDERDVDADGLTNWDEAHGRMTPKWWELTFTSFVPSNQTTGSDQIKESVYPGRSFEATSFVDPDTDGDTIRDGADDEDHDGFTNAFEVRRPDDWETTYVSTSHPGTNPRARVNPFNPCKPFYSSTCHRYPPFDYYQDKEDWASPVRQNGP